MCVLTIQNLSCEAIRLQILLSKWVMLPHYLLQDDYVSINH